MFGLKPSKIRRFFTIKGLGSLLNIVALSRLLLSIVAKLVTLLVTLLVTPFLKLVTPRHEFVQYFSQHPSKIDFVRNTWDKFVIISDRG